MPMTAPRDNAQAIFREKSRSFSLAARLFAPDDQLAVARLYRFCRHLDDLADDSHAGEAPQLAGITQVLLGAKQAHADSVEADFLRLAAERSLPIAAAVSLADALRADCGPRQLETPDALIQFAYGVAGTVGLLVQKIIGATAPQAAPFAVDLGIALQLTNIARDVAEDARRDRFYLPSEWVTPSTITAALKTGDSVAILAADNAVQRVLQLAATYYESGRVGHWFIPRRNRRVTFLAAGLYEAIGHEVLLRRPGAWRRRVSLGFGKKLRIAVQTIPRYRQFRAGVWNTHDPPTHDPALHRSLATAGFHEGIDPITQAPHSQELA